MKDIVPSSQEANSRKLGPKSKKKKKKEKKEKKEMHNENKGIMEKWKKQRIAQDKMQRRKRRR